MRRRPILLALLLTILLTAACGNDDEGGTKATVVEAPEFKAGSTMAALSDKGSIKIGVKFDQPGLGNLNPSTDKPEGFDVEIGKIVAGKLGIESDKIEWIETVSANRETAIENGTVDLVIATYTINDERKKRIDFAGPYYVAGQDLLISNDDDSIKGPDDLAGKKVCAASGSTPIENIRTNYPDAEPVEFDTYTQCVDQLVDGAIDAVSTDDAILAGFAAEPRYEGKLKVVGKTFSEEPYGIGIKKGDDELRTFLNDTLEASFEDETWATAFTETLGKSGVDTPQPPKVDRY